MYCLKPPLSEPPEGSWSCHLCIVEYHSKETAPIKPITAPQPQQAPPLPPTEAVAVAPAPPPPPPPAIEPPQPTMSQ